MTTMGKSLQSEHNDKWLLVQSVFRYLSSSSREIGPANPYFAGGAFTANICLVQLSAPAPQCRVWHNGPKGCRASRKIKRHLCPVPFPLLSLLSHWSWGWDSLSLAAWSGRTLSLAKSVTASHWSRQLQQSLELQARGSSSWSTPVSSAPVRHTNLDAQGTPKAPAFCPAPNTQCAAAQPQGICNNPARLLAGDKIMWLHCLAEYLFPLPTHSCNEENLKTKLLEFFLYLIWDFLMQTTFCQLILSMMATLASSVLETQQKAIKCHQ